MKPFFTHKKMKLYALIVQGIIGLFAALLSTATAYAQTSFTRSNAVGNSAIADNACFTSFGSKTITVTDTGTLLDLDVGVVVNHTWRGDLQVQLISPAGTNRTIINGVGVAAKNLNVRLRDGETAIADAVHPATSSYANTANLRGPSNPLSAYDGESVNGNWELRICDSAGSDTGALEEFYLHFTTGLTSDLSLAVSPASATRSPGQQTTFTLTVSNDGPDVVSGVTVDALLPSGLAYVGDNGGGAYVSASGVWTIAGSIAVGAVKTLQITTSANASGDGNFVSEVASSSNADPDSTPGNLATTTTEDDTATATVTLVAVQAAPPAPLACAAPLDFSWVGRTWPAGSLTNSYSTSGIPFEFTFSNAITFFQNNAAYGGQTPILSTLLTGGQPSATSLLYVVNFDDSARQSDLTFTAGVLGEGVDSLQFGMFDVDENPNTAANVNFIDRMTIKGTLGGVAVPVVVTPSTSNSVSGNVATGIAAAGSTTSDGNMWVTFSSPVDTVLIEYDNDPAVNTDPGNQGVGFHTIGFCPQMPDLELTKQVDNTAPVTGTNVTYTLTLSNVGTTDGTGVEVTDLLPAGLSFVSAVPSQGGYDGGTGIWTVGTVGTTTPATLSITALVSATTGTISNTAEVTTSTTADLDSTPNDGQGDDYDSVDITIVAAAPQLASDKTVAVYDPGSLGLYAVPGNDVIYTINVTNTGNIAIDSNSVFLVDSFPSDIAFYNGDIDGGGPHTDPVVMDITGTPGLTLTYANDIGYSNLAVAPTNMAGCSYSPSAGYDANVRFICFAPKGAFASTNPDSAIAFSFRARIPSN